MSLFQDKELPGLYPVLNGASLISEQQCESGAQLFIIESGSTKYAAKRYPSWLSEKRLLFTLSCQLRVEAAIGKAPKILLSSSNRFYCLTQFGYYVVSHFAAGSHLTPENLTPRLCACIGTFLADVHGALAESGEIVGESLGMLVVHDARQRIGDLLNEHKKLGRDDLAIRALSFKLEELLKLPDDHYVRFLELPVQPIHGDFHLGNLLYDDVQDNLTLLDFDKACVFYRCYELLRAAFIVAHRSRSAVDPDDLLRSFLGGYRARVQLTEAEVAEAAGLFYWVQLCDTYCFELTDSHSAQNPSQHSFASYRFRLLEYLRDYRDYISSLLSGVA